MVAYDDQSIGTGGHAIETPRVADGTGIAAIIIDGEDGLTVKTPRRAIDRKQFNKLEVVVRTGRVQMNFVEDDGSLANRTR